MRIGLFMGSFDPMHIGHISIVTEVFNKDLADNVIIVPAKCNPWKGGSNASYEDRIQMCALAALEINDTFRGTSHYGAVSVSRIEETFAEPVYSSNVIKRFMQDNPNDEFCILCGTDVANQIHNWHDGEWIVDHCKIIDIGRIGEPDVNVEYGMKLSSTAIRNMLENHVNPYPYIIPEIYYYIRDNNLYI